METNGADLSSSVKQLSFVECQEWFKYSFKGLYGFKKCPQSLKIRHTVKCMDGDGKICSFGGLLRYINQETLLYWTIPAWGALISFILGDWRSADNNIRLVEKFSFSPTSTKV